METQKNMFSNSFFLGNFKIKISFYKSFLAFIFYLILCHENVTRFGNFSQKLSFFNVFCVWNFLIKRYLRLPQYFLFIISFLSLKQVLNNSIIYWLIIIMCFPIVLKNICEGKVIYLANESLLIFKHNAWHLMFVN